MGAGQSVCWSVRLTNASLDGQYLSKFKIKVQSLGESIRGCHGLFGETPEEGP